MSIDCTSEEYKCLMNDANCPVKYGNFTYRNAEAAWLAQRSLYEHEKKKFSYMSAEEAEKFSKTIDARSDWHKIKYSILVEILLAKFTRNVKCRKVLLSTGMDRLVTTVKGYDMVGRALMEVRGLL